MGPQRNELLKVAREKIISAANLIQIANHDYHKNDEDFKVNILSHMIEQLDDISFDLVDKAGCLGE